jgi:hypothetical protein
VAIEENRRAFNETPVSNIDELNTKWAIATGWNVNDPSDPNFVPYHHRPYQQLWFQGDHGAVGGGRDTVGLSSATLMWIAEGAHHAGLEFRQDPLNELWQASQKINPMENWHVDKDGTPRHQRRWMGWLGGFITRRGPERVDEVGLPAKIRWCRDPAWRPKNLGVLNLSDCQTFAIPAAPPGFPPSAPGFPPDWTYAMPSPSGVTPSAAPGEAKDMENH